MSAPSPSVPILSNSDARRIFLAAHGLLERPSGTASAQSIADQITTLGFVQVDSINTVARAHDHILWSRMPSYRQGRALRCLTRTRALFEGWTHDAALLPTAAFPHWRRKFASDRAALALKWERWGRAGFQAEFDRVLDRIARDGALSAAQIDDGARQNGGGWWDWKPTKTALEYLWRTGELGICHRKGFTKVYDLTERLIPPEHLNARADEDDTLHWSAMAAMDRLGFATPSELAAFWDIFPKARLAAWADPVPEGLTPVNVESADGTLRAALIHADWEARLAALPAPSARLRILSPFDPALRDRKRVARLFGFDFRIEVFVPEEKRRFGYYVFPILEGTRLTGRIDLKADRTADTLRVQGYWPEPRVTLGAGRSARLMDELTRIAKLAEVSRISIDTRPQTQTLLACPHL